MLEIEVKSEEYWNPKKEVFEYPKPTTLKLEYSLLSLAKWESKWHKPYLSNNEERTTEETLDFIRCMTVNHVSDPTVYDRLTKENMEAIRQYIEDPATATKFYTKGKKKQSSPGRKVQTAETIYALMIECGIPIIFEQRHLNHLFTLIRVCQERSSGGQKMTKAEQIAWQREQNELRKRKYNTKG